MTRKTFLSALFATAVLVLPVSPVQAQGGACLSDRAIQNAVASGKILPLNEILALAGLAGTKVLPPVKVCDQGGQPYYIVSVLQGGQAQSIALNAITGKR